MALPNFSQVDDVLELEFPREVSRGSVVSIRFNTEVQALASGATDRIARWAQPLWTFDLARALERHEDYDEVAACFMVANGQRFAFLFENPIRPTSGVRLPSGRGLADPAPTDQELASLTPDESTSTQFQLSVNWSFGGFTFRKDVYRPTDGTVRVAVDGSELGSGDFSVDPTTGVVTLNSAVVDTETVTAGFEYLVPVRFDMDELPAEMLAYGVVSIGSVMLVEERPGVSAADSTTP